MATSKLISLKEQAQAQYDKVKEMNFLAALQYTEGGYNQFRLIYERPGELGTYLYPADNNVDRKNLYREYSHLATQLFREKMEEHELGSSENLTLEEKKDRAFLYHHAWESGHANGFNEVYNCYLEAIEEYNKFQNGTITREEFEDFLNI
jgi:hypothetical protein